MSHVAEPRVISGAGSNPIGPASGDLAGTYPAPSVIKINGATVPASGALVIGNVLQVNGTSSVDYAPLDLSNSNSVINILPVSNLPSLSGNVTGNINSNTVIKINGASVPVAGSLTIGNGLYVTGASTLSYSALNLGGGTNYVTGLLPSSNQASQPMSGDVTGTTAANTVEKIQNRNVDSTAPTDGYVLTWDSISNWWEPSPVSSKSLGPGTFGCFSSTVTQPATLKDTAYIWEFNTTEISKKISITNNLLGRPTRVTVDESGVYEFAISPQLNKSGGNPGTVSMWIIKNNSNLTRSCSTCDVGGNLNTQLPFVSVFVDLNAGEYVEFAFSASTTGISVIALPAAASPSRPASPSIILVAKKISSLV